MIGQLVSEILMFKSVDGQTDGRTPARVPYYKLTLSLRLWWANKKRYDSELPYQRPDLIEVMEIEIDLTISTNVHTSFYKSVRECLDCWRSGVKANTICNYCAPVVFL